MNSEVTSVPASETQIALPLSKTVRMAKKDFFATLPATMKCGARKAAFEQYASEFSAREFAAISGAVANGSVLVKANRETKKGFTISLVRATQSAPRAGKVAQLEAEIASLKALLGNAVNV